MRGLLRGTLYLGCGAWLALACSGDDDPAPQEPPVGRTSSGIVGKCQVGTYGSACDPDDTGPLEECEGICDVAQDGKMECFPITSYGLPNLDGFICGDEAFCSSVCSGKQCVNAPAPDGTACRPTNIHDKCAGACLAGVCVLLDPTNRCPYGRGGQGSCTFETCDPLDATKCEEPPLTQGVKCTGGECNGAGTCGPADGGAGAGGTAGSSGASGAGGSTGGTGGTSTGGTSGAGGTSGVGGTSGAGGTAGSAGSAGSAGAGGSAGSAGSAGAGGSAGSAGAGGSAGSAGSAGAGGSAAFGGAGGSAGSAGSGGSATGGSAGDDAGLGGAGADDVVEGGGCACSVPARESPERAAVALLGALALALLRRSRRR
jgi:hypothetical protein